MWHAVTFGSWRGFARCKATAHKGFADAVFGEAVKNRARMIYANMLWLMSVEFVHDRGMNAQNVVAVGAICWCCFARTRM